MLTLVGSHYHFRRVVPSPVRDAIGKREVWFSLRTADRLEAKARASYLYGQTSILFHKARYMTPDEVTKLLTEGKKVSTHTIRNAKKSMSLFVSCFGDMDVTRSNLCQ